MVSSRTIGALLVAAVAVFVPAAAAAQQPHEHGSASQPKPDGTSAPGAESAMCAEMMKGGQVQIDLASAVEQMNAASGEAKMALMADVVSRLARQQAAAAAEKSACMEKCASMQKSMKKMGSAMSMAKPASPPAKKRTLPSPQH